MTETLDARPSPEPAGSNSTPVEPLSFSAWEEGIGEGDPSETIGNRQAYGAGLGTSQALQAAPALPQRRSLMAVQGAPEEEGGGEQSASLAETAAQAPLATPAPGGTSRDRDGNEPFWDAKTRGDAATAALSEGGFSPETFRPAGGEAGDSMEFVLTRMIGQGGQGEVWSAWQTTLDREVAVKRLVHGNLEQFLQECYALGELDHPNIVPAHDLGRSGPDPLDPPLLAMKRVRGKPWDQLMRAERPKAGEPVDAFLARHMLILIDVCNAVAYAHSKGIIHRDLKPHQAMVGEYGEVYLMDWGLAVCVRDKVPRVGGMDKFQPLASAQNRCGTPAYMAPEQTGEEAGALGFHTDIYLLGAILYELVQGRPPHAAGSVSMALRKARDNQAAPLPAWCPPELRALAGRALATDPAKRPASVTEFREALKDYLGGAGQRAESAAIAEAVESEFKRSAGKGRGYENFLGFELRLNRAIQLWPANQKAAELRMAVFERYASRALRARDLFLAETLASALPEGAPRREEMLQRVGTLREGRISVVRQRRVAFALLGGLALALPVMAVLYVQGLASSEIKARRERDRAEELVSFMLGDLVDELEPLGRVRMLEDIVDRAQAYYKESDGAEASDPEALRRRAAALRAIGDARRKQGDLERAMRTYEELGGIARRLKEAEPEGTAWRLEMAASHNALGETKRALGDLAGAQIEFWEAFNIAREQSQASPDDPAWKGLPARYQTNLGVMLSEQGVLEGALGHFQDALAALDRLLAEKPAFSAAAAESPLSRSAQARRAEWRACRAEVVLNIGHVYRDQGKIDAALDACEKARDAYLELTSESFANAHWQSALSIAHNAVGDILSEDKGDFAAAAEAYAQAFAIRKLLAAFDPENALWKRHLSSSHYDRGRVLQAQGDFLGAFEEHGRALEILDGLTARDPSNTRWRGNRARALNGLGLALLSLGQDAEALESYREAAGIADGLGTLDEANIWWKTLKADACEGAAKLLERAGQWDEALRQREAAAAVLTRMSERSRGDARIQARRQAAARALERARAKAAEASPAPSEPPAAEAPD